MRQDLPGHAAGVRYRGSVRGGARRHRGVRRGRWPLPGERRLRGHLEPLSCRLFAQDIRDHLSSHRNESASVEPTPKCATQLAPSFAVPVHAASATQVTSRERETASASQFWSSHAANVGVEYEKVHAAVTPHRRAGETRAARLSRLDCETPLRTNSVPRRPPRHKCTRRGSRSSRRWRLRQTHRRAHAGRGHGGGDFGGAPGLRAGLGGGRPDTSVCNERLRPLTRRLSTKSRFPFGERFW